MTIPIGKRDIQAIAEVMDGEWETLEDATRAVIAAAWERYEAKAKWTAVGQLSRSDGPVDPSVAPKIALGWFPTEKQAKKAAESLAYSTATHEECEAWTLPVWQGSAHSWYKERKDAHKLANLGITPAEKLSHLIQWQHDNPDKSRDEYPGPPQPNPKTACPICGTLDSESEDEEC